MTKANTWIRRKAKCDNGFPYRPRFLTVGRERAGGLTDRTGGREGGREALAGGRLGDRTDALGLVALGRLAVGREGSARELVPGRGADRAAVGSRLGALRGWLRSRLSVEREATGGRVNAGGTDQRDDLGALVAMDCRFVRLRPSVGRVGERPLFVGFAVAGPGEGLADRSDALGLATDPRSRGTRVRVAPVTLPVVLVGRGSVVRTGGENRLLGTRESARPAVLCERTVLGRAVRSVVLDRSAVLAVLVGWVRRSGGVRRPAEPDPVPPRGWAVRGAPATWELAWAPRLDARRPWSLERGSSL